ncbi:MAG: amidohydrolase family protein [Eubacterium sp.]|nr:amidohydrolase family protein [Eubacterium sp.]
MLIDCHVHCALSGLGQLEKNLMAAPSAVRQHWFENLAALYVEHGIGAVRDGGDKYGVGPVFKEIAQEAGIIFKTPLVALFKKGHYGGFLGQGLSDLSDCKKAMDSLLSKGPDHIKIIQSGIMSFETYGDAGGLEFSREELVYMIDRAHDAGLKVMVHVNTPQGVKMSALAGADTVEHGYCIDDEAIAVLKETGCIWVPTLAPFANIAACSKDHFLAPYREISKRYFENHKKQVRRAHKAGVKIALGSDSGATLVAHGEATLQELGYLKDCGLTEEMLFENSCRVLGIDPAAYR